MIPWLLRKYKVSYYQFIEKRISKRRVSRKVTGILSFIVHFISLIDKEYFFKVAFTNL